ncbi:hypothetical protein [Sneathiella sp.]|uniref:hypothetical protein n=1 Tax=Sneathiella sp. TaxID=1964365 RepID=UPI003565CD92
MKAAFLTSSLIASKGKASPASTALTPRKLIDDGSAGNSAGISRIYNRVRDFSESQAAAAEMDDQSVQASTERADAPVKSERNDAEPAAENTLFAPMPDEANDEKVAGPEQAQTRYSVINTANKTLPRPKPVDALPESRYEEIATEVSKLKKDGLGRIRISVRMAPQDHLQLKLIAAHTQMSAQTIFETALEEYVANHGTEILPQSCKCIFDKSSI